MSWPRPEDQHGNYRMINTSETAILGRATRYANGSRNAYPRDSLAEELDVLGMEAERSIPVRETAVSGL